MRIDCFGILVFAHRPGGHGIDVRLVMPVVGADLERKQRMLLAPDRLPMTRTAFVSYRSPTVASAPVLPLQRIEQRRDIAGAVMIDVVGAEHLRARTSAGSNSLRWWCGSSRSRRTCRCAPSLR